MPFPGLELSIIYAKLMLAVFRCSVSMRSVKFRGGRIAFRNLDISIFLQADEFHHAPNVSYHHKFPPLNIMSMGSKPRCT